MFRLNNSINLIISFKRLAAANKLSKSFADWDTDKDTDKDTPPLKGCQSVSVTVALSAIGLNEKTPSVAEQLSGLL